MSDSKKMVLRTVYISPELDDLLRVKAFRARTSKNDLIRNYVVAGMRAEAEGADGSSSKKGASAKKATDVKQTPPPKTRTQPIVRTHPKGVSAVKSRGKKTIVQEG